MDDEFDPLVCREITKREQHDDERGKNEGVNAARQTWGPLPCNLQEA